MALHRARTFSVALMGLLIHAFVSASNLSLLSYSGADQTTVECTVKSSTEVSCDGVDYNESVRATGWEAVAFIGVSIFLVLFAGLMSGLTMGLLSLDLVNLKIIAKSGTERQKKYVKRITPLVEKHHLLLVTLLCANAIAMEALPIFLDRVVGPLISILLSVTAVLAFGEIIPQALCTRYGLAIGANMFWLVWALMLLFLPIAWPVSILLDCLLGKEHMTFYRRADLKELIELHRENEDLDFLNPHADAQESAEKLTTDEVTIMRGAIDMARKTVAEIMTPVNQVFMLDFEAHLDRDTMKKRILCQGACINNLAQILEQGHSRVPVYRGNRSHVIGMILVKRLILLNPEDAVPISSINLTRVPVVTDRLPLYDMLNQFQTGKSHMAIVVDYGDSLTMLGIVTLEDVIEELIQEEIVDETDIWVDVARQVKVVRAFKHNVIQQAEERRRSMNLVRLSQREDDEDEERDYGDDDDYSGSPEVTKETDADELTPLL